MNRRVFLQGLLGAALAAAGVGKADVAKTVEASKTLTASQLEEFVHDALRDLGTARFTDIAGSLQRDVSLQRLLQKKHIRLATEGVNS